jgi:hypothetical protein
MSRAILQDRLDAIVATLRGAGARFALLHGSRVTGSPRADSDLDVAAWWSSEPPNSWDVLLPDGVDLLVLNAAPLELAGRVALHGTLLFDDDPPARVLWQSKTRSIYLDEEERQRRLDRVYHEGRRRGR